MRPTLSDQLAACAHQLELGSDELSSHGLPNSSASVAAALLGDVADRVASAERNGEVQAAGAGDRARVAATSDPDAGPHPRELLALSGKEWDFSLPGCATFGCIHGRTDEEEYRVSHDRLCDRLRVLDEVDFDERHQLLEAVAEQWEAYEPADAARWHAARLVLSSLGVWRSNVNDPERYATFAPIPGLVAELITALDDAEYEEYCSDCDGVSRRQARGCVAQTQQLTVAISDWADDV
jgi:hypothetical protein